MLLGQVFNNLWWTRIPIRTTLIKFMSFWSKANKIANFSLSSFSFQLGGWVGETHNTHTGGGAGIQLKCHLKDESERGACVMCFTLHINEHNKRQNHVSRKPKATKAKTVEPLQEGAAPGVLRQTSCVSQLTAVAKKHSQKNPNPRPNCHHTKGISFSPTKTNQRFYYQPPKEVESRLSHQPSKEVMSKFSM